LNKTPRQNSRFICSHNLLLIICIVKNQNFYCIAWIVIISACSILVYHILLICIMLVCEWGLIYLLTYSITNFWTLRVNITYIAGESVVEPLISVCQWDFFNIVKNVFKKTILFQRSCEGINDMIEMIGRSTNKKKCRIRHRMRRRQMNSQALIYSTNRFVNEKQVIRRERILSL